MRKFLFCVAVFLLVAAANAPLGTLSSAEAAAFPPLCMYQACYQTPEGCGCEGFYCNGQFICGYPIKG